MAYRPTFKRINGTQFVNSVLKRKKQADNFLVSSCFTQKRKENIPNTGVWQFDKKGNMIFSI